MKHKYPFTNAIVFSLVMRNPRRCRGLLKTIFSDRKIRDVRLHTDYVDAEHTIIAGIESRKVRLDVLFGDDDGWYDIELQVRDEHDLPKRTRYAHASLDVRELKAGEGYNKLKPSYVIFLCCFDYFNQDKPLYSFEMHDVKNDLPLQDETYTIILNSRSSDPDMPPALKELFGYMNEETVPENNTFLQELDHSVEEWNTGEKVNIIMTLEQEILIKEARAREEGIKEGIKEGSRRERERNERRNEQENAARIRRMHDDSLPVETIAEYMGCTPEQVKAVLGL